jgi:hypothetical protein
MSFASESRASKATALLLLCSAISVWANPSLDGNTLATGMVSRLYDQTLAVTGGTAPYKFAVTAGSLPAGFQLGTSSGRLSGVPQNAGDFSFTVQVTDSKGLVGSAGFRLPILPNLRIASVPCETTGSPRTFRCQPKTEGGLAPYQFSVAASNLPPNLQLDPQTGTFSWTTLVNGTYWLLLRVQDRAGFVADRQVDFIVGFAPTITTPPVLPPTNRNLPYSQTLTATSGAPPYGWSLAGGSLPPGITLSQGGVLSGTPTAEGTFQFTVRLQDSNNGVAEALMTLTVNPPLRMVSTGVPATTQNATYSNTLAAAGGTTPYVWSLANGSLPPGITLSPAGVLSGSPTASGTYPFTVRVRDAAGDAATVTLSLVVNPRPAINESSLPAGRAGAPYSASLTVTGGTGPFQWTVPNGGLPPGIAMSASGALSGTPTSAGSFPVTVRVTDSAGATAERTLTIVVGEALSILTSSLPPGMVGSAYFAQLQSANGSPPLTWSLAAGNLPAGLELNQSTGGIAGTPTVAGEFVLAFAVTDNLGQRSQRSLTLRVVSGLSLLTDRAPTAEVGEPYSYTLPAGGGEAPYTFALVQGLPPGLTLRPDGVISGVPTDGGSFQVVVRITDSAGRTNTFPFSMDVLSSTPSIRIETGTVPSGEQGRPFNYTFPVSGGDGSFSFSISQGSLPPGISLSQNGTLSGTPTESGDFFFTVRVESGGLAATRELRLQIQPGLRLTLGTLQDGYAGEPFTQQFTVEGGQGPFSFRVIGGSLPPGLSLDSNGRLSGTPTPGSYRFTVEVTDLALRTATRVYDLLVFDVLTLASPGLPEGRAGEAFRLELPRNGGRAPLTFSLVSGNLPPGLQLSTEGIISGIPTTPGDYTFVIQVEDANGRATQTTIQITITPGFALSLEPAGVAVVERPYLAAIRAPGDVSAYTLSIIDGQLPPGLELVGGKIQGSPTTAGEFSFRMRAVDRQGVVTEQNFTIPVGALLALTSPELPESVLGRRMEFALTAAGGVPPYRFSVSGATPPGLELSPETGLLSGTPTRPGKHNLVLIVTDAQDYTAQLEVALDVLAPRLREVAITGLPATGEPATQPDFQLSIVNPYPGPIEGILTLAFRPGRGQDDPAVLFPNGSRTLRFEVPAGETTARFPGGRGALQTGTVAGDIMLEARLTVFGVDVTPETPPTATLRVPSLAPRITSVEAVRTTGGFDLVIVGYSTPRDMQRAGIRLEPAPGSRLDQTSFTVDLGSFFLDYYNSAAAAPLGSQFRLTLPIRINLNPAVDALHAGAGRAAECGLGW